MNSLTSEELGTIIIALRKYASDYCVMEEDIDATYDTIKKVEALAQQAQDLEDARIIDQLAKMQP